MARLRTDERLAKQGALAAAVGEYVINTSKGKKRGNSEFKLKPLKARRSASPADKAAVKQRLQLLKSSAVAELLDRGLIEEPTPGVYRDLHGNRWEFPKHMGAGTGSACQSTGLEWSFRMQRA